MSTPMQHDGRMISDEELIRLLDGELTADAATALHARIATVAGADQRLEQLRRRGEVLSDLLTEVAPAAEDLDAVAADIRAAMNAAQLRPRTAHLALLRVAAMIAAIAAVAAVPQARAWIAGSVLSVLETLRPATDRIDSSAGAVDGADVLVRFAAGPGAFRIVIDQPAGRLILRTSQTSTGSAEIEGAPGAHFVIMPGALRVDGPLPPDAVILVSLPATVDQLSIEATGRSVSIPLPATGTDTMMELLPLLR